MKYPIGCVVLAGLLLIGAWVTMSYFEAASYNRITGEQISTWDALWLELRIVGK